MTQSQAKCCFPPSICSPWHPHFHSASISSSLPRPSISPSLISLLLLLPPGTVAVAERGFFFPQLCASVYTLSYVCWSEIWLKYLWWHPHIAAVFDTAAGSKELERERERQGKKETKAKIYDEEGPFVCSFQIMPAWCAIFNQTMSMLECVNQIFVSIMSPPQKTHIRQTFVFVCACQSSNQIQNATIRDF